MSNIKAAITGVGGYVPDYVLTNKELETMVETSDEWITTRTGIKERRILKGENLGVSYMGAMAVKEMLAKTNTDPNSSSKSHKTVHVKTDIGHRKGNAQKENSITSKALNRSFGTWVKVFFREQTIDRFFNPMRGVVRKPQSKQKNDNFS